MTTSVGILIRDNRLQLVELARERQGVRLLKAATQEYEPGNLQAAFDALWANHRVRAKRAVFGVGGSAAFVRTMQVLAMKKDKLEQAIRFELQQQTPFDLSEVEWDWAPLTKPTASGQTQVVVAAVKKNLLDEPLSTARQGGWEIQGVGISSLALYNCAQQSGALSGDGSAYLLVDIGRNNCDLVLVQTGAEAVMWARSLPIGLGGGQSDASELIAEIKRAVEVFRFQTTVAPEEVHLSGNIRASENVQEQLGGALQIPVQRLNPVKRMEAPPEAQAEGESYAVACGLAMQGLRRVALPVDLLRQSREQSVERKMRLRYTLAVSMAAWLFVLSTALASQRMVSERQLQLEQMDRVVERYRALGPKFQRVDDQLKILDERLSILMSVMSRRTVALDLLNEVLAGLGPDTWLEQVTMKNSIGQGSQSEAIVAGKSPSYQDVNGLLNFLKTNPMFADVKPISSSVERTPDGSEELVAFSISLRIQQPPSVPRKSDQRKSDT